jgi:hypothetical protein
VTPFHYFENLLEQDIFANYNKNTLKADESQKQDSTNPSPSWIERKLSGSKKQTRTSRAFSLCRGDTYDRIYGTGSILVNSSRVRPQRAESQLRKSRYESVGNSLQQYDISARSRSKAHEIVNMESNQSEDKKSIAKELAEYFLQLSLL